MPNGEPVLVTQANGYIRQFINDYFEPGTFPVKSLIFDARLLRTYLQNNPNIENVKFMLGVRPDNTGQDVITMVIVGYDTAGNYIKMASPGGDMVLDHASQCPPTCPTNGNAQQDFIV